MSKKKIIKLTILCVVLVALLAGLITMMATVKAEDYDTENDVLKIGESNFGGRLLIGLKVAVLGIGTVFAILMLLILVVTLMRLIFEGAGKLKEKQVAKKAEVSQKQEVKSAENASGEDEEVVAVIMAALNAYYETQNVTYKSNLKFRVRSIKEI